MIPLAILPYFALLGLALASPTLPSATLNPVDAEISEPKTEMVPISEDMLLQLEQLAIIELRDASMYDDEDGGSEKKAAVGKNLELKSAFQDFIDPKIWESAHIFDTAGDRMGPSGDGSSKLDNEGDTYLLSNSYEHLRAGFSRFKSGLARLKKDFELLEDYVLSMEDDFLFLRDH